MDGNTLERLEKDVFKAQEEEQLTKMLDSLRIIAETYVLHWSNVTEYQSWASSKPRISCLKSACEMVRCRSSKTAVTFLYLPSPPPLQVRTSVSKEDAVCVAENYLNDLEILTNHWPPTLLVRGVSPVTSTTL